MCRLEACFRAGKQKVVLIVQEAPLRRTLVAAFKQTEYAEVKSGRAPAGYMEEELSAWLEALQLK